jgi:hypothetical protein
MSKGGGDAGKVASGLVGGASATGLVRVPLAGQLVEPQQPTTTRASRPRYRSQGQHAWHGQGVVLSEFGIVSFSMPVLPVCLSVPVRAQLCHGQRFIYTCI